MHILDYWIKKTKSGKATACYVCFDWSTAVTYNQCCTFHPNTPPPIWRVYHHFINTLSIDRYNRTSIPTFVPENQHLMMQTCLWKTRINYYERNIHIRWKCETLISNSVNLRCHEISCKKYIVETSFSSNEGGGLSMILHTLLHRSSYIHTSIVKEI